MNPMNLRRRLAVGMFLGAVFVALELLVHGILLRGAYQDTASLWRPESDRQSLYLWMAAGQFLFGILFGIVYAQGYEPRRAPLGQGLRYGLIMGLMLAPVNSLGWYVALPVPPLLCAAWMGIKFMEMLLLGIVASFVYKPA